MGDISAEPSMEEILSSIKRIIAEEEAGVPPRPRRSQRPTPSARMADDDSHDDEILELSDPMPAATRPEPVPQRPVFAKVTPEERKPAPPPVSVKAEETAPDPIVSARAATATRGSLDALTRMVVKPEAGGDGTLEGLVRDLLRPMLAEWLDARLPEIVETMVAKEIARISSKEP